MMLAQGAELSKESQHAHQQLNQQGGVAGGGAGGVEWATWEENSNSDRMEENAANIDLHPSRRSYQFLVTPTES